MTPAVRPRRRCRVARRTGVGREGEPAICAVHTAAAGTKERFGRTFLLAPLLKGKEAPSERNSIRNWRGETGRGGQQPAKSCWRRLEDFVAAWEIRLNGPRPDPLLCTKFDILGVRGAFVEPLCITNASSHTRPLVQGCESRSDRFA